LKALDRISVTPSWGVISKLIWERDGQADGYDGVNIEDAGARHHCYGAGGRAISTSAIIITIITITGC